MPRWFLAVIGAAALVALTHFVFGAMSDLPLWAVGLVALVSGVAAGMVMAPSDVRPPKLLLLAAVPACLVIGVFLPGLHLGTDADMALSGFLWAISAAMFVSFFLSFKWHKNGRVAD